jgi:hypothetical protein
VRTVLARAVSVPLLALAAAALACGEEAEYVAPPEFGAFAIEIADALERGDLEHLVANTNKVQFRCDAAVRASVALCAPLPVDAPAEGFDVKMLGRGDTPTVLDGPQLRDLLGGMFSVDLAAPADEFGGPALTLYSTLHPDPTLFIPSDADALPERGTIAITYIGPSRGEGDPATKRRLFAAVAEKGSDGSWVIRLWAVGFFRPDHPAMNPGEDNAYERWQAPLAITYCQRHITRCTIAIPSAPAVA